MGLLERLLGRAKKIGVEELLEDLLVGREAGRRMRAARVGESVLLPEVRARLVGAHWQLKVVARKIGDGGA